MGIPTSPDSFASLITSPGPIHIKKKEDDPVLTQINDKSQAADEGLESSLQKIGGGGEIHVEEQVNPGAPMLVKPKDEQAAQLLAQKAIVEEGETSETEEGGEVEEEGGAEGGVAGEEGETTDPNKKSVFTPTSSARQAQNSFGGSEATVEEQPLLEEGALQSEGEQLVQSGNLPTEEAPLGEAKPFSFQAAYPELDPDQAVLLQSFGRGGALEGYSQYSFSQLANMLKNGELPMLDATLVQYAAMGEGELKNLGYLSNKEIQQIQLIKMILQNAQREETVKNLTSPDGPLNMMAEQDPASILQAVQNNEIADYPAELLQHVGKSYEEIMEMVEKGEITPEEAAKILELQAVNSAAVGPSDYRVQGNYMQFLAMLADFLEELKIEMQEQGYEEIERSEDVAEGDTAGAARIVADQQGEVLGPEEQSVGEEITEAFVEVGNFFTELFGGTVESEVAAEDAKSVALEDDFSVGEFFAQDLEQDVRETDQQSGSVQQFLKSLNQLIALVEGMKAAAEGGGGGVGGAGGVTPLGGAGIGVPNLQQLQEMSGVTVDDFGSEYSASAEFGDLEAPNFIKADNLFNGLTPAFMETFGESVQSSFMVATGMLSLAPRDPATVMASMQMVIAPFESISPGFSQAIQGLIDLLQIATADPNSEEGMLVRNVVPSQVNGLDTGAAAPGIEPPGGFQFRRSVELENPDTGPVATPATHDLANFSLNFTANDAKLTHLFGDGSPLSNYADSNWSSILMQIQNNQITAYDSSLLGFVGKSNDEMVAAGLSAEDIAKVGDLSLIEQMADREMSINNLFVPGAGLSPYANMDRAEVFNMVVNDEIADYPPSLLNYINMSANQLQNLVGAGQITEREFAQVIELQSLVVVVTTPAYYNSLQGTSYATGIPPAEEPSEVVVGDQSSGTSASAIGAPVVERTQYTVGSAFINRAYADVTAQLPESDVILLGLFTAGGNLEAYGDQDWGAIWTAIQNGEVIEYDPALIASMGLSNDDLVARGLSESDIAKVRELGVIKQMAEAAAVGDVPPPAQFRFQGNYMRILAAVEELINQVKMLMLEEGYGEIEEAEDAAAGAAVSVASGEDEEETEDLTLNEEIEQALNWDETKAAFTKSTYECFGTLYSETDLKNMESYMESVDTVDGQTGEYARAVLDDLKSVDTNEWAGTYYGFDPFAFEDLFVTTSNAGEEDAAIDVQNYVKLLSQLQKLFEMLKSAASGGDVGGGLAGIQSSAPAGDLDANAVVNSASATEQEIIELMDTVSESGFNIAQNLLGTNNPTEADMRAAISAIIAPYAIAIPELKSSLQGLVQLGAAFVQGEMIPSTIEPPIGQIGDTRPGVVVLDPTGVTSGITSPSSSQRLAAPADSTGAPPIGGSTVDGSTGGVEVDPSADFMVNAQAYSDNLYKETISQLSQPDQILIGLLSTDGILAGHIDEATSWNSLWDQVQNGEIEGFDLSLLQYVDLGQDELATLGLDKTEMAVVQQLQTLSDMAKAEVRSQNLMAPDGVFSKYSTDPAKLLQMVAAGQIPEYPANLMPYMGMSYNELSDQLILGKIDNSQLGQILDLQAIAMINVQPTYYRFVGNYLAVLAQVAGWLNQIQAMMMAIEGQGIEVMAKQEIANNHAAIGILGERIDQQKQMRERQDAMKIMTTVMAALATVIAVIGTVVSAGTLGPALVGIALVAIAVSAAFAIAEACGKSLTQDLLVACGESRTSAEKKDWIAKLVIAIILTVMTLGAGGAVLIGRAASIGASVGAQVAAQAAAQAAKAAVTEAAKKFFEMMVPMMVMGIMSSLQEQISKGIENAGASKEEAQWATMGIMLAVTIAFIATSIAGAVRNAKAASALAKEGVEDGTAVAGGSAADVGVAGAGGASGASAAGGSVAGAADDAAGGIAEAAGEAADQAKEAVSAIRKLLTTMANAFKGVRSGAENAASLEKGSKVMSSIANSFEILSHGASAGMGITMAVMTMEVADFEKEIAELNSALSLIDAENQQLGGVRENIVQDFVANYSETTNQIDQIFFQAAAEMSGIMSQLHNTSPQEKG